MRAVLDTFLLKCADVDRAAADLALWKSWDSGGRKSRDMAPLLRRFAPMLRDRANVYLGKDLSIPPAAIEAEFKKQFLHAAETYKPGRSSLGTHVFSTLRAASRFITTNQNVARIPETRIFRIGELQRAKAVLDADSDKPPTAGELAKFLKWRVKDVATLQRELRKDLTTSKFPVDINVHRPSAVPYAVSMVKKELSPQDREVFQRLLAGAKPKTVAKTLKMSPSSVSRSKYRITERLQSHLRKYSSEGVE